ncbi:Putative aconitate hydratase [Cladobotryum mycophilum]|uniref:Aconitate hydratase n=1 Tax=Cladobotryum mycophilum TaxID=491253 RepID=A0ABR0SW54_9HYPO
MAKSSSESIGLAIQWSDLLEKARGIQLEPTNWSLHPISLLNEIALTLKDQNGPRESSVFQNVAEICLESPNYGGLGLSQATPTTETQVREISFLLSAWLESLNSEDRKNETAMLTQKIAPVGRPPMTATEKIFAVHAVDPRGYVKSGDTIRVSTDWIMASEASWSGMEGTYDKLGQPGIFRNDRFWLAGDHVVDPRIRGLPPVKKLIESSERARKVFKMTDYQGLNYTIMHTEFFRERAQPGMLIVGSDSHTCSSGANGCLAIGLGAADVTMALITGETWFKVPEVINIKFVGRPSRGIGGKDVILYVLQQLKRNTVAADRIVEYTGPGLEHLSPDARFAIANMTTEFGGVTGIFVPDHVTKNFVDGRKLARHKTASMYFRPDEGSIYAESFIIDLSKVRSFVAKYPNPDDVVPVAEVQGMELDGCFIGACTTAEEDIILGALVLEQGLKNGWQPSKHGKRKVVPGSLPILDRLRKLGLAQVYEDVGFEVGVPGCSYCVGMSADQAGEGEVWLSSQNRNFINRMGRGSIGNLASAATVAASSFDMKVTNPQSLIDQIPLERWEALTGRGSLRKSTARKGQREATIGVRTIGDPSLENARQERRIQGKVQRLGHFVDTDALAPAQFLISCRTNKELGEHCLEYTNPDFRSRIKEGFNVVVAGKAFGCGSSREQAVSALIGCGVQCVIAESFAFIYGRNQPSLGLLGICIDDQAFYTAATDGVDIDVNLNTRRVHVAGREFPFQLSDMEIELVELGGITPAFTKFGKEVFDMICGNSKPVRKILPELSALNPEMQW